MDHAQARLVLVAAILASGVVFLDGTIVNVALPAISDELGGGLSGQQWLNDGYLLTLGSVLLLGGSLGDLHGRRRVLAVGLAAFGAASLLCALAPTIETLVAARAVQGLAGALLVPNALGLIVAKFEPQARGAAIGTWTAWTGVALVGGPFAGGLLVDAAAWRWIFAINVVPVALALWVLARVDGRNDTPTPARLDVVGTILATLGLAGPVFALIEQPVRGWDPLVLATLVGGLALLAAFVVHERRTREPMLPLGLFRDRNFSVGNLATMAIYGGLGAAPFALTIFLQQVAGYSALEAGLAQLPVTLLMLAGSTRVGALSDRLGPRLFMGVGPVVAGAGIALLARLDADADYLVDVLPAVLIFGVGLTLTVTPLTATVLGSIEERNAGMASAVNNAVARIGGLLAIAAVGAVVGLQELDAAAIDGFQRAMLLTGALIALGGILSAIGIRSPRRPAA